MSMLILILPLLPIRSTLLVGDSHIRIRRWSWRRRLRIGGWCVGGLRDGVRRIGLDRITWLVGRWVRTGCDHLDGLKLDLLDWKLEDRDLKGWED